MKISQININTTYKNEQAINTIKKYLSNNTDNIYLSEKEFGEPITETKIVTKIHAIAKNIIWKELFNQQYEAFIRILKSQI